MLSGKSLQRVSLARMRRAFVGTYLPTTRRETWIECGHFLEGVQLLCEDIFEVDGDGSAAEDTNWFTVSGSATPAQNTADDFAFYYAYLRGKRSFAFWCDDNQLWFFKTYYLGNGKILDNRITIVGKRGYDSPRQQEQSSVSCIIPGFEIVVCDKFSFSKGTLTYTRKKTVPFGNVLQTFSTKRSGSEP